MSFRGSPAPSRDRPGSAQSSPSVEAADTRRRQGKRDEAIRKRIENDLARKRPATKRPNQKKAPAKGTVSSLRPSAALTVPESMTVSDASQLCAARRVACVLVVSEDEHLTGVLTAKDLALRVVADGLDPRTTTCASVMTKSPMVARDNTSATEALQTMVSRGFRHLPVCNVDGDVVGLLDIAKVFHESLEKLERAYGSSQKLYAALEGVQSEWNGAAGQQAQGLLAYVETLRERMASPDLGSILDAKTRPVTATARTTVRDCAKLMREHRTTCILIVDDAQKLLGLCTSKDIVLRVIAAGLDAKTCSVVRVMTPHPDTAPPTTSIQEALRKMHDGHYLNMPIVEESGALVGCVDVLKLTYATLEQINSIGVEQGQGSEDDSSPVWSRFFASLGAAGGQDADTESVASDHHLSSSIAPSTPMRQDSEIRPGDSASANGADDTSELGGGTPSRPSRHNRNPSSIAPSAAPSVPVAPLPDDGTYLFKFLAPGGTTHRFQARYDEHSLIRDIIAGKLASDPFFAPGRTAGSGGAGPDADPSDFAISYVDDDGDLVLVTTDRDVADAVAVARKANRDRVVLTIRGGRGWEGEIRSSSARAEPAAPAPPPLQAIAEGDDDGEDADAARKPSRAARSAGGSAGGDVAGIPKDLVLPAAIGFLGVVIIGVFLASRGGKK